MKALFYTLIVLITSSYSFAQYSTGSLQFNNISTKFSDAGVLFENAALSMPAYEFPNGSNLHTIFSTGLWFGATDSTGQARLSASYYLPDKDMFYGPVSTTNDYGTAYISAYAPSVWFVTMGTINNHIASYTTPGYVPDNSILFWPGNGDVTLGVSHFLAPFIDLNNDGFYDPYDGDYPDIRGDAASYIIMNDVAKSHTNTSTPPLGIEVHVMLYQYATNDYLNNQTFMNIKVFNRGDYNYTDFTSTLFNDFDIGYYMDDYYGCDISRDLVYGYNADAFDEGGPGSAGYGASPPCTGVKSLNQPLGSSGYIKNMGTYPYATPSSASEYWNYMNGTWQDGSGWFYGGMGYAGSPGVTTTPTSFLFSGNPNNPGEWSEMTNGNVPGDVTAIMNSQAQSLGPNEMLCYDYAIISDKQSDNLTNVQNVLDLSDSIQIFFDSQNFSCSKQTSGLIEGEFIDFKLYPNPSNGDFTIVFHEITNDVKITVRDLAGRIIYVDSFTGKKAHSVSLQQPSGIYYLIVETNEGKSVEKIVVQ